MSSLKQLILFLILATALNPIMAGRALFSSSGPSVSGNKARVTTYSSSLKPIPDIIYELFDNSTGLGDTRFRRDIGLLYGVETLAAANQFVLDTLYRGQKPSNGKDYNLVEAIIESFGEAGIGRYPLEVASTVDNNIRINSDYLLNFYGDVKYEFTGIMYHESTHVWQNNGKGSAPAGLITGIADFVRLKAGLPSVNWGKRGEGNQWDQGYEVTAYFLEYLNAVKKGFVAELNAMMTEYYTDGFFKLIFGKSVDDLWIEYKFSSDFPFPSLAPAPTPAVDFPFPLLTPAPAPVVDFPFPLLTPAPAPVVDFPFPSLAPAPAPAV